MAVREGHKRSLNVSLDFVDPKQRLDGYKTLNLLNSHEDPTFLHTVLYFDIARQYIPAPKANFVKVVINGESWGLYVNAQQFDKTFLAENFTSAKGARWKVPGNPGGRGGLEYLGDDVEDYKRRYEIKTGDDEKDWKALDRALQDAQRDAAGPAGGGPEADPRRRRRALVPGPRHRPDQQRRLLDPRQRLQHLPRPEGQVPRHPARHERDLRPGDDVRPRPGGPGGPGGGGRPGGRRARRRARRRRGPGPAGARRPVRGPRGSTSTR